MTKELTLNDLPMVVAQLRDEVVGMKQMILDLDRTENYSIEFTVTSLMSAMAAAIGNSCYIQIKGNWITSPILYVILVGRP